jgi:hypothetical protein
LVDIFNRAKLYISVGSFFVCPPLLVKQNVIILSEHPAHIVQRMRMYKQTNKLKKIVEQRKKGDELILCAYIMQEKSTQLFLLVSSAGKQIFSISYT